MTERGKSANLSLCFRGASELREDGEGGGVASSEALPQLLTEGLVERQEALW